MIDKKDFFDIDRGLEEEINNKTEKFFIGDDFLQIIDFAKVITDADGGKINIPKVKKDELMSILEGLRKYSWIGFNKNLYFWNDLFWEMIEEESFSSIIITIYRALNWRISINKTKEIYNLLYSKVKIPNIKINSSTHKIPLNNGYYNLENKLLEVPEPRDFFTYFFDYAYNENSDLPAFFINFMKEFIPNEESRNLLLNYIVYSMTTNLIAQKMIVIIGKPRIGKTVFTSLLNNIFINKICNMKLQDLTKKHATSSLTNKLINVGSDLADEIIKDVSTIKSIITDEFIDIRPLYKPHTTIRNITKHLFTANFTPSLSQDVDYAFYRRLILISTVDKIQLIDTTIIDKLINEIDTIIQYLLINYSDLAKLIDYNEPELNQKLWFKLGSSVNRFVYYNTCLCDLDSEIQVSDLYSEYKKFCKMQGYDIINPVWFSRRLGNIGIEFTRQYNQISQQTERIFQGIEIKKCTKCK